MKHLLNILLLSALFIGCTEPYIPELKDNDSGKILMVEGYIDADGNSEYTLGYVAPIFQATDSTHTLVNNAQIAIEEENGQVFKDFSYEGKSRYVIHHPSLNLNSKYRLRIKVADREYLSDYVPVLVSPEIEDLRWKQNTQEGVRFYLDTHDENQAYYRWTFEETWRFRVPNISLFLFDGKTVRERTLEERYPYFCHTSEKSPDIHLYTTEAQSENVVKDFNVHFIPSFSEKLGIMYSIVVKQYALTKEAFGYWGLVKKNSEEIGDIFGTMPTELTGNITCISHPAEKVVGMIEAGKVAEKRLLLSYSDLPIPWVYKYNYYGRCVLPLDDPMLIADHMVIKKDADAFFAANPHLIPIDETGYTVGALTHYSYSSAACLDCRYRGTVEPPAFWPNQ